MENIIKSDTLRGSSTVSNDRSIFGGIITGQIAGLIMAVVVMMVFTVFLGKGPLYPVQVIGSVLFGESALQGFHFGAFLTGLILHQAGPSLLWGFLFGVLAKKVSMPTVQSSLGYGVLLGLISMVGPYILIPFVMNSMQGIDLWNREVPILWDWAAHIVFGLSFGLYPLVQRKLTK